MLRNPKKSLQAINNCVTVAMPLTEIDIDYVADNDTTQLEFVDNLTEMKDVDVSALENGSILIFNEIEQKWQSTRMLRRQILDAGEY